MGAGCPGSVGEVLAAAEDGVEDAEAESVLDALVGADEAADEGEDYHG